MSINSINHTDMTDMATIWEADGQLVDRISAKQIKSAEARRRIEMLNEIRESGLTMEEARELGLLDLD